MIAMTNYRPATSPSHLSTAAVYRPTTAAVPEPLPGYVLIWTLFNYFSPLGESDAVRVESE
jgi:hypothetical protein